MKILGVLGSPHKNGNTAILLDAVLGAAAAAGAESERMDLANSSMNFCVGCSRCYRDGRCQYDDDVEEIKAKMLAADGIVLGSPVYIWSVSAQMKTLMDRCAYFIHCFMLEGKYGAAVATAGGSGQDEIAAFQNQFLRSCGAQTIGLVGALGLHPHGVQEEAEVVARAEALGSDLVAAIAERRRYPEQEEGRQELFQRMKWLVSTWGESYPAQYAHWQEKGWL